MKNLMTLLDTITTLHDDVGHFANSYQNQHQLASQANIELHKFVRPESVITALSQGVMLIEVAADQLMGVAKTLTEPAQAVAPWSCLRALLESCALASWLLSPHIEVSTRVQRSLAFRYVGLSQQLKFIQTESELKGHLHSIKSRIDDVEQLAQSLGYAKVVDKTGKRTGIGQQMPNITTLVKLELDEEPLYRLLSAMAHAHPWAVRQLSYQITASEIYDMDNANQGFQVHWLEKNLEPVSITFLCYKAITNFIKPVWRQCQYFGWDQGRLESIFDQAYNKIGITQKDRFWQNNCEDSG